MASTQLKRTGYPSEGSAIHSALDAVLTFHLGPSTRPTPVNTSRLTEIINELIAPRFFEELFVLRPEVTGVLRHMTQQPFTVAYGPRGCGKSTLISFITQFIIEGPTLLPATIFDDHGERVSEVSALRAEIKQDPSWYFYFDMEANRRHITKDRTVCSALYDLVWRRGEAEFTNFLADWSQFIEDSYGPILDAKRALRAITEQTGPEVLAQHEAERLVLDARLLFQKEAGSTRLEFLLDFLTTKYDVAVGFAIDNVDLFPESAQTALARTMSHLAFTMKLIHYSVLGVRTSTLDSLAEALKGAIGFKYEDAKNAALNDTDADVLAEVLRLRMEMLPSILATSQVREALARQQASGYVRAEHPLFARGPEVIAVLTGLLTLPRDERPDQRRRRDHLANMLRWHNNSVRSVAGAAYRLGYAIISDSDPMFTLEEMVGSIHASNSQAAAGVVGQTLRNRERFAQSLMIRNFVSANPASLALVDPLLVLQRPLADLQHDDPPFSRLHLLLALYVSGGKLSVDELRERLGKYGFTKSRVDAALRLLLQSTGNDERGLVRIDGFRGTAHIPSQRRNDPLDGRRKVDLLPAGVFLLDESAAFGSGTNGLSTMVEYIFWNVYSSSRRDEFLPTMQSLNSISEENVRVSAVCRYLDAYIVPRFIRLFEGDYSAIDMEKRSNARRWYLADYVANFGGRLVVLQMLRQLSNYVKNSPELSDEMKASYYEFSESQIDRVRAVFRDANALTELEGES